MAQHREIIQLTVAYTLTGALIFTVIITCLATAGWIRLADKRQQKKLFNILLVELVVGCVAFFVGFIRIDARGVEKAVADRSKTDLLATIIEPEMSSPEFSANNPAAIVTWGALKMLQQLGTPFDESGKLRLSELRFWDPTASEALRNLEAKGLASQLDAIYRHSLRGEYERSINHSVANLAMAQLLTQPNATVAGLAKMVDELYTFPIANPEPQKNP